MRKFTRSPYELTDSEWGDLQAWFRTSKEWNKTVVRPGEHTTGTGLHFILEGFEVRVDAEGKHHWWVAFTPWSSRIRADEDSLIEHNF